MKIEVGSHYNAKFSFGQVVTVKVLRKSILPWCWVVEYGSHWDEGSPVSRYSKTLPFWRFLYFKY